MGEEEVNEGSRMQIGQQCKMLDTMEGVHGYEVGN